MVSTNIPLYGIEESVVRNVVIGVTRDIQKLIGVSDEIYTQFDPKDNIQKQHNQTGELQSRNNQLQESIEVTFEEESEPEMELVTNTVMPDSKPIFQDDEIEAKFTPIYQMRKLNIQFKYKTMSKSQVYAVANRLRVMTANDAHTTKHDLEYYYNIGMFPTNFLVEVNTLKNNLKENKEELEDYIGDTFDDRVDLSYTHDADLNKAVISIREAQLEVNGYIEDEVYNINPEHDEEYNNYTLEFNYTISYEKPISLLMSYNLLVYNQLIDPIFRDFIPKYKKNTNAVRTGRIAAVHEITEKKNLLEPLHNRAYFNIPNIDEPRLPDPIDVIDRMFCVLCIIDIDNPRFLFNLRDIPGIRFKKEIYNFLINEGKYVGEFKQSVFLLELYQNSERAYKYKLFIDNSGNVMADKDLDIRRTYRVMFNVISDLTRIDPRAKNRIANMLDNVENSRIKDVTVNHRSFVDFYLRLYDVINEKDTEGGKYNYNEIRHKISNNSDLFNTKLVMEYRTIISKAILEEKE